MGDVINFPGCEDGEETLDIRDAHFLLVLCVDYAFEHDQINEMEYLLLSDALEHVAHMRPEE